MEGEVQQQQSQIVTVVKEQQYLIFAFIAGALLIWVMGGAQGENTGYLVFGAVVLYIVFIRRSKKEGKTIIDMINEIAEEQRRNGLYLDTDPKNIRVLEYDTDQYYVDFLSNHLTFKWTGKLAKGLREISAQSVDTLKRERDSHRLELKRVDIEELTK